MKKLGPAFVAVGLLSLAGAPRRSEACLLTPCPIPSILPNDNATVPANLSAIEIDTPLSVAEIGFELRDAANSVIAVDSTSGAHFVARPRMPLAAGIYTVHFNQRCNGTPNIQATTTKFTVGATASAPAAIGSVGMISEYMGTLPVTSTGGSCTEDIAAGLARFNFQFDASLVAYQPLTRFTLEVDGTPWAAPRPGLVGEVPWLYLYTGGRSIDLVGSFCDAAHTDKGLPQGSHHGVLRADVQGIGPLPPLAFDFKTSCAPMPVVPEPESREAATGCAIVGLPGAGGTSAAPGFLLFGALALSALRRRKGRS